MAKTKVGTARIEDFKPMAGNANLHTERGMNEIERGMGEDGYVAPMTAAADGSVLDGNARLEVSGDIFPPEVLVVHHDGTRPVVMVRDDIPNGEDPKAKRIAYRANRAGELNLRWNPQQLFADGHAGVQLDRVGFRENELNGMLEKAAQQMTEAVAAQHGADVFDPADLPDVPGYVENVQPTFVAYVCFKTFNDLIAFLRLLTFGRRRNLPEGSRLISIDAERGPDGHMGDTRVLDVWLKEFGPVAEQIEARLKAQPEEAEAEGDESGT